MMLKIFVLSSVLMMIQTTNANPSSYAGMQPRINTKNLMRGMEYNFLKYSLNKINHLQKRVAEDEEYYTVLARYGPYAFSRNRMIYDKDDCTSLVRHYGPYAFARNRRIDDEEVYTRVARFSRTRRPTISRKSTSLKENLELKQRGHTLAMKK